MDNNANEKYDRKLSDTPVSTETTELTPVNGISKVKNAAKKVFLCDSEKLGTQSAYKQCTLYDIDYLVSENEKAAEFATAAENLTVL